MTATGCYSFGAVLAPATGPPIVLPPGDPDETLRVVVTAPITPWQVRSQVSVARIRPGQPVTDTIIVSGLVPDRVLSIRPALLGPVPAVTGGCAGVDWVNAQPPVAADLAPIRQTGNGTVVTPAVRPVRPGCYTFETQVTNGFQTGGEIPVPHGYGDPTEIVQVLAGELTLTTHTTKARVLPGQPLRDRLHLAGATGSVRATATLYGPFGSHADITCRPTTAAASVSWEARSGTSRSPAVRVRAPGLYTWQVTTAPTTTNAAGTHACGLAAETTTVARSSYPAPIIDGGFSGTLEGPGHQRTAPMMVRLPGIGLRALILREAVDRGRMTLPNDVASVGWLRRSARFTDAIGTTVIAGHVSDRHDRPGAMYPLSHVRAGQKVTVVRAGVTARFKIVTKASYRRTERLPQRYFSTTGPHRIVLVSCTDRVVTSGGHFHYTRYQVVVAKRIR